jgi:hypothetical protein
MPFVRRNRNACCCSLLSSKYMRHLKGQDLAGVFVLREWATHARSREKQPFGVAVSRAWNGSLTKREIVGVWIRFHSISIPHDDYHRVVSLDISFCDLVLLLPQDDIPTSFERLKECWSSHQTIYTSKWADDGVQTSV